MECRRFKKIEKASRVLLVRKNTENKGLFGTLKKIYKNRTSKSIGVGVGVVVGGKAVRVAVRHVSAMSLKRGACLVEDCIRRVGDGVVSLVS